MNAPLAAARSNKPFVIGDPVHRYVKVVPHERLVIDHPVTQRLRHIAQTGFAHYVFPEARTSRFSHSLGAMHLASKFLLASLENALPAVRRTFFDQLEEKFLSWQKHSLQTFVPHVDLEEMDALLGNGDVAEAGLLAARSILQSDRPEETEKWRRLMALAEAGVRLAALFHDLGHFPFSHDFELALQEYKRRSNSVPSGLSQVLVQGVPPHEILGHKLAQLVMQTLVHVSVARGEVRAAYWLATEILNAEPGYKDIRFSKTAALEWLHSLIDGDIDVDRADYLLRDGRNLGVDFAPIDLDRLVANLVLVEHPEMGLVTAIDERGAPAAETFLIARSRSNQCMVRHHKVVQFAAAFRYATVSALLDTAFEPTHELISFFEELHNAKTAQQSAAVLKKFASFDDAWWLCALRRYELQVATSTDPKLKAALALVLRRESTLLTIWKRGSELNTEDREFVNQLVDEEPRPGKDHIYGAELLNALEAAGYLVVRHKFVPFSTRGTHDESATTTPDQLSIETPGGAPTSVVHVRVKSGLVPLSEFSGPIGSLRAWYAKDLHFHLFRVAVPDECGSARTAALNFLRQWKPSSGVASDPD